jgi:hypothetical protein
LRRSSGVLFETRDCVCAVQRRWAGRPGHGVALHWVEREQQQHLGRQEVLIEKEEEKEEEEFGMGTGRVLLNEIRDNAETDRNGPGQLFKWK